jgi:cell wall-associated NlpC family hydrolase
LEQAFIQATGIHLPLTVADGLANNYVLGGFLIPDIPVWIQIPFPYTKSAPSLQAGDLTFYDLAPDDIDPPGDGNIEHSGIYCGNGYWLWASATIDLSGDGKPEVVYFHREHPGKYGRQMKDMTEKIFMHRRWTYPEN